MKKITLLCFLFCFYALNAQTYEEVTPSSFVQGVENNCASAIGDFNGDGKLDIVLTGKDLGDGNHKTWLYLNDGNGGFSLSTNSNLTMGFIHSSIGLGDYDGDGDLDIVIQGWDLISGTSTQRAYVYQNNGNGIFTEVATLDGRSNGSIEFGDYDNDGKLDILQTGWRASTSSGVTTIYHNDGSNVFTNINNTTVFGLADGHAKFGDYDKDGKLDIIVNGWMQAHIYKGDGAGNFTNQNIPLSGYDFSYVYWLDYDKDGFLDILLGGHYNDDGDKYAIKVYKGTGTNSFTDVSLGLPGIQKGPIRTSDCNNDGKTDFFISGWKGSGYFGIYKNDGTNTSFTEVSGINSVISGWADGMLEVADFDGDGYVEIFKCGWGSTKLYKNIDRSTPTKSNNIINNNDFTIVQVGSTLRIQVLEADHNKNLVELYSISGKKIFSNTYATNNINITVDNLSNGFYILKVRNNKSSGCEKIRVKN